MRLHVARLVDFDAKVGGAISRRGRNNGAWSKRTPPEFVAHSEEDGSDVFSGWPQGLGVVTPDQVLPSLVKVGVLRLNPKPSGIAPKYVIEAI